MCALLGIYVLSFFVCNLNCKCSKYILKIAKCVARCFWKKTLLGESEKVLNLANKISKLATLDGCHDKFSLIEFHLNQ